MPESLSWISECRTSIDEVIRDQIEGHLSGTSLEGPVGYSLFPGGKRIRPLLALGFCLDIGGQIVDLLPAAAALEIAHTASLIHDDLPSLDDDDMRRGRPSLHKQFGEPAALLAGDLMIALAFKSLSKSRLPATTLMHLVQDLSGAFMKLCLGQQMDMQQGEGLEDLLSLHKLKTGALFAASLSFGARGAGLEGEAVTTASALGELVGLGFQIADDFIDLFGTDQERGRSGSSDERNRKRTFFTAGEPGRGMELLLDTQRQIENGLNSYARFCVHGQSEFTRTRQLVDTVVTRVKKKLAAGACGC